MINKHLSTQIVCLNSIHRLNKSFINSFQNRKDVTPKQLSSQLDWAANDCNLPNFCFLHSNCCYYVPYLRLDEFFFFTVSRSLSLLWNANLCTVLVIFQLLAINVVVNDRFSSNLNLIAMRPFTNFTVLFCVCFGFTSFLFDLSIPLNDNCNRFMYVLSIIHFDQNIIVLAFETVMFALYFPDENQKLCSPLLLFTTWLSCLKHHLAIARIYDTKNEQRNK